MNLLRRALPDSYRDRAALVVTSIVLGGVLGAWSAAIGGVTLAGFWAGVAAAASALGALLALMNHRSITRRHRIRLSPQPTRHRAASVDPFARVARRRLRRIRDDLNHLRISTERQGLQLRHTADLVASLGQHHASHQDVMAVYAQLQAFIQLRSHFTEPPIVPTMRGWAASPDVVLHLVRLLMREKPRTVVECGSGASTLWLAAAAREQSPHTRVVALEHDLEFAEATRRELAENGLSDWADVRYAPLQPFGTDGGQPWYSRTAVENLEDVGLVFVDGPPGSTSPLARKPALEALADHLTHGAAIVLDDTIRREELAVVEAWRAKFPWLGERTLHMEKGATELRWLPPESGAFGSVASLSG